MSCQGALAKGFHHGHTPRDALDPRASVLRGDKNLFGSPESRVLPELVV